MKTFELANYQLATLQNKKKVYSMMFNSLKRDDAIFKLSSGSLDFALIGTSGIIKTSIPISYEGETQYFEVDYRKFDTVLQKFIGEDKVNFSTTDSLLKIYTDTKKDLVNLQIMTVAPDSSDARMIDEYLDDTRRRDLVPGHHIEMTEDIINKMNLFSYLFDMSSRVNAVGFSKTHAFYSDRSIVVKDALAEPFNDAMFEGIEDEDGYIYLHSDAMKLMSMLHLYKNGFDFDSSYSVLFWNDDDTSLIYQNDDKNVVLPNEEQWEGIKPQDQNVSFNVSINQLGSVVDFFNGIYVETGWKPLEIACVAGKTVEANYRNPLAEASKEFEGVTCPYTGKFVVDADTLRKIISKEKDIVASNAEVSFIFDEDGCQSPAPGILIKIGDDFEAVMSKLSEN